MLSQSPSPAYASPDISLLPFSPSFLTTSSSIPNIPKACIKELRPVFLGPFFLLLNFSPEPLIFPPCPLDFPPFLAPPCPLSLPTFLTSPGLLCFAYGLITGSLLGGGAPLPPSLPPSHLSIVLGAPLAPPPALLRDAPLRSAPLPPPPAVLSIPFPPPPLSYMPMRFFTPSHSFIVLGAPLAPPRVLLGDALLLSSTYKRIVGGALLPPPPEFIRVTLSPSPASAMMIRFIDKLNFSETKF